MSEAEILEVITNWLELSAIELSVYLTLVSAYLVVAYIAAEKLTSLQLTIVNILYTVMASMTGFTSAYYYARAISFQEELLELRPNELIISTSVLKMSIWIYGAVLFAGISASVYFMIASRRSTKE